MLLGEKTYELQNGKWENILTKGWDVLLSRAFVREGFSAIILTKVTPQIGLGLFKNYLKNTLFIGMNNLIFISSMWININLFAQYPQFFTVKKFLNSGMIYIISFRLLRCDISFLSQEKISIEFIYLRSHFNEENNFLNIWKQSDKYPLSVT